MAAGGEQRLDAQAHTCISGFAPSPHLLSPVSFGLWVVPDVSLFRIRTKCPGHRLGLLIPRGSLTTPPSLLSPPTHRDTYPGSHRAAGPAPGGAAGAARAAASWSPDSPRSSRAAGGGTGGVAPHPPQAPVSHPCSEPHHKLHEATETPEGIHLVLNDVEDRGEKVAHALDVACGDRRSGPAQARSTPRGGAARLGRPPRSKWYMQ